jgi:hypothetical protein
MRSYFQNSCFVFYRGIQTPRNSKSSRPAVSRAFICFSVFGYPDKALALVLEIVHLKDISKIRRYLSQDATEILIHA